MEINEARIGEQATELLSALESSKERKEMKDAIDELKLNISKARHYVILKTRELIKKMNVFASLELFTEEEKAAVIRDLTDINNNRFITEVSVAGTILSFTTIDGITCSTMGGLKIRLDAVKVGIDCKTAKISLLPLDEDKGMTGLWGSNQAHPHVASNGDACFGNVDAALMDAISKRQYYATVLVLLDFLQSCNEEDSAGKYYHNWPKIMEDGSLGIFKEEELHPGELRCHECGDWLDEDDINVCTECGEGFCENHTTYYNAHGYLCADCRDDEYVACTVCGELMRNEDAYEGNGEFYCQKHYEAKYTSCTKCGAEIKRTDAYEFEGNDYCKDCHDMLIAFCPDCEEEYMKEDMYDFKGDYYCETCFYEKTTPCIMCGEAHEKGDMHEDSGNMYCTDCYNELVDNIRSEEVIG